MPPANPTFSLHYDRTTKLITTLVCGLLLLIAVVVHNLVISVLFVLVVAFAYAWSPRRYSISAQEIVVSRLIGDARFPLTHLREIRRATEDDVRGAIRLMASGGLFGWYGLFRTAKLWKCSWYVTNRQNMVVAIATRTALFSPDDVDGFLALSSSVLEFVPRM